MDRTPEQKAADDELDAAIRRVSRLDKDDQGDLMVDWIVCYACVRPHNEEEMVYGVAFPGGTMPVYRILGLMEVARAQLLSEMDEQ